MKNLFLIISNIPTPYRQDLFNSLSAKLKKKSTELQVIYMREIENNRSWNISKNTYKYKYLILNSKIYSFLKIETYLTLMPFYFWLKKNPKTTLLAGAWHYPANLLIIIFSYIFDRNVWFWSEANKFTNQNNNFFYLIPKKCFYKICQKFVVPGSLGKSYVMLLNKRAKIIEIPNSVENYHFNKRYRKTIKTIKINKYHFLTISQISDRKNILPLVNLFINMVENKQLSCKSVLHICGSGPLEAELLKLTNQYKYIKFYGNAGRRKLDKLFNKCNVFLLNSKYDPSPLVVNEAITRGLIPIISKKIGNSPDVRRINNSIDFTYNSGEFTEKINEYINLTPEKILSYSDIFFKSSDIFYSGNAANKIIQSLITK